MRWSSWMVFIFGLGSFVQMALADTDRITDAQFATNQKNLRSYITQDRCPFASHRGNFGPHREQRGLGLCWAFAATALVEEQLCLDQHNCGKSLSPLDASRCQWSLNKYKNYGLVHQSEGGSPQQAMKCVLNGGICLEADAPYDSKNSFSCGPLDSLFEDREQCMVTRLKEIWDTRRFCSLTGKVNSGWQAHEYHRIALQIQNMSNAHLTDEFITQALTSSKSAAEFTEKILLTSQCAAHRIDVNPHHNVDVKAAPPNATPQQIWDTILSAFQAGRSAAITVCLSEVTLKNEVGYLTESPFDAHYGTILAMIKDSIRHKTWPAHVLTTLGGCMKHSIVVDGLRWNDESHSCEMSIRNSYSEHEDVALEGWVPAGAIAPAITRVQYLAPTGR